ncbi:diguanylate cyclase [Paraburkholderia adhaesiva]|uniref:diguanylate cyclase n=1 Tax=Paraburkholderia adhaesiva TaxID=2883244 RepID=UPI001F310E50|nr:diguanylate cyclase [Paraburkholderia adhaesiva]
MELTLLALQDVMLSAMTANLSLSETMSALCCEVHRIAPEIVVSTLRLDSDGVIHTLAAPGLPSGYNEAIDGKQVAPDFGTCGPAMMFGRPVLTRDIHDDPNWHALMHLAKLLGMRACWSHPIKDRTGRVLGSLAFYFRQPTEPTDFHGRLAEACLRLCVLAFEHEEAHSSLQRLAWFDSLTGLPNRAMLEREADRILARARRAGSSVSVLMLDVDHFKQHNDTLGHLAGDKALRVIANCIADSLLRSEGIAGRYGGEEFCVVLQDAGQRQAIEVAQAIRRLVEEVPGASVAGVQGGLTVSVGVSTFDGRSDDSFEDLIGRADQCLYEAKRTGRNRVVAPQPCAGDDSRGPSSTTGSRDNLVTPGVVKLEELAHLYGDDLAPEMAALTDVLRPIAGKVVDEFHEYIQGLPGVGKFMRNLADPELYDLKRRQIENLMLVASPDLTSARHRTVSLKAGRVYAIFGVSSRDLAHAQEILHAVVSRHVDATAHHAALATLSRRLTRELTWQIEAARLVHETSQDVLLRITELAWSATSHADLIVKAASIIGALDGCAGCSFGRPAIDGAFRFESVSGERLRAYLADIEAKELSVITKGEQPQGQGPTGRAWTGGQVERCMNVETDYRMGPWLEIARRYGIRSSVAIPLSPPNRTPGTVLTLYSKLPGGYASAEQVGFIRQMQALLTFAIARLESGSRTVHALPWSTRQRWASLIGTSALEMHYQPIRHLVSGRVKRAEALARLRDGDEVLAPGKFFPCLSREDFVVVYTRGLHQVLEQQNRWLSDGLDMELSINLPAEAIHDPRFYEITREALRRYGNQPQRLMLEVLETSDMVSGQSLRHGLDQFRALGIKLAEDDLGAGHSSLDRLRSQPFDVIKLDRSLVLGVERTPIDVLSSIYQLTNLCHALGKTVVVEGVESVDLIDAIALLGADAAQGYAIARPMPAAGLTEWMRQHCEAWEAPDRANPEGHLARLAKLLIWETHLRLLFGSSRSRVFEIQPADVPILPFESVDAALQMSLLDAARHHGTFAPEYLAARERLIAALM